MSWENDLSFGTSIEDFVREYFEEVFNWKFVAGTFRGKVINHRLIEEMFSCEYIPPGKDNGKLHGPQLKFDEYSDM